jgi:polysaccharide biosynthesis protein PslH
MLTIVPAMGWTWVFSRTASSKLENIRPEKIMHTQRRLIFLLPFAPRLDATHGGGKVMAQLLSSLSLRHKIGLVYLRGVGEPPLDELLQRQCEIVEEVIRPWTGASLIEKGIRQGRLVASLASLRPLWVTDWACREFSARVRAVVQDWQPEVIHIENHIMGQYLPALSHCPAPRILTEHEPSERAAPYLQSQNGAVRILNGLDRKLWRRYEASIIRSVQTVIVFTDNDLVAVERLNTATPVVRIPLGTKLPEQPSDPVSTIPPNLLFFGNFYHPPNAEAAMRLVSTIFPAVRSKIPDVELFIVGDQPPPALIQEAGEGVVITRRVPDVTPYLSRATLVVVPLRLGGGMRVKMLEALALGKAIIASPVAAEGLDLVHGKHYFHAESDSEFCQAILQLLSDPEMRGSLSSNARAWACANLTWDEVISKYEALYKTLLDRSG